MAATSHFEMTETDFNTCFNGALNQARAHGLDTTDPQLLAFVTHQATVAGWAMAESRSLQNMLHPSAQES